MDNLKYEFDSIASIYDAVRPKPPFESMVAVKKFAKLNQDSRVLEVGVGTGQATESLMGVGCEIVGLELGTNLVQIAQQKFSSSPNINIYNTSFEDWQPQPASFDLCLSVQAFHWIDTTWGLNTITINLKKDGTLAIMWHLERSQDTDFYKATQPIYDRFSHLMNQINSAEKESCSTPNNWHKVHKALKANTNFKNVTLHRVTWQQHFDKSTYLKLLQTFSNHNVLIGQNRVKFYAAISEIIDNFGGSVTRKHETITLLAHKATQKTLKNAVT